MVSQGQHLVEAGSAHRKTWRWVSKIPRNFERATNVSLPSASKDGAVDSGLESFFDELIGQNGLRVCSREDRSVYNRSTQIL